MVGIAGPPECFAEHSFSFSLIYKETPKIKSGGGSIDNDLTKRPTCCVSLNFKSPVGLVSTDPLTPTRTLFTYIPPLHITLVEAFIIAEEVRLLQTTT